MIKLGNYVLNIHNTQSDKLQQLLNEFFILAKLCNYSIKFKDTINVDNILYSIILENDKYEFRIQFYVNKNSNEVYLIESYGYDNQYVLFYLVHKYDFFNIIQKSINNIFNFL